MLFRFVRPPLLDGTELTFPRLDTGICESHGECELNDSDTAKAYGNEQALGNAIRESKIPREEFFITTKLEFVFVFQVEGAS